MISLNVTIAYGRGQLRVITKANTVIYICYIYISNRMTMYGRANATKQGKLYIYKPNNIYILRIYLGARRTEGVRSREPYVRLDENKRKRQNKYHHLTTYTHTVFGLI